MFCILPQRCSYHQKLPTYTNYGEILIDLSSKNPQMIGIDCHAALINRAIGLGDRAYPVKKANKSPAGAVVSGVFAHSVGLPFR